MLNKSNTFIELANGRKCHITMIGNGDPVLCVSGFGCDHYPFTFLAEELADKYKLIIPDNRGMGANETEEKGYTLKDLAIDYKQVMEKLGHEKFSLIGVSMGGFIAQLLATHYPKNILKMALLCTSGPGNDFRKLPVLSHDDWRKFYSLSSEKMAHITCESYTHPSLRETNSDHYQRVLKARGSYVAPLEQIFLQQEAVIHFLNSSLDYQKIQAPTLILSGREDRFVDPENSRILKSKIKHSLLEFIPESDHFFFLEKPKEIAISLNNFLKERSCPSV